MLARSVISLAAGALLLLGAASPASAFCRSTTCTGGSCARDDDGCKTTGKKLFWPGACVGFSLQKNGTRNLPFSDVRVVIEASFFAWSDLDCGGQTATMTFSELSLVSCHQTEYNPDEPNANIVLFQDDKWSYKGVDNTLAKTTVTFDDETGEIFDADIEVNYAFNEMTIGDDHVVYDLQSIMTHEIGHFIGLDHTSDAAGTMNAAYDEGDTSLRTLEPDDIAGACEIYAPGRAATCHPTPRNGLGKACGKTPLVDDGDGGGCNASSAPHHGAPLASLVVLLGIALLRRERSRRS